MAAPSTKEITGRYVPRAVDQHSMVDTKTAARVLGLRSHHTLEVWRSTGAHPELRFFKIGRAIRYRIADLEAYLTANAVGVGPAFDSPSTGSVGKEGRGSSSCGNGTVIAGAR